MVPVKPSWITSIELLLFVVDWGEVAWIHVTVGGWRTETELDLEKPQDPHLM